MRVAVSGVDRPEALQRKSRPRSDQNKMRPQDRAVHDWYRFVLSYPPHLVQDYLDRFGMGLSNTVLDPFCGTGTTPVECKKRRVGSVGIEPNPMAHFASSVKVAWEVDSSALLDYADVVAAWARKRFKLVRDLRLVRDQTDVPARVLKADARGADQLLAPNSVDAVITSPPYPNEKDYTRTTRLESVILGLIRDRRELRSMKQNLLRSNSRGVYKTDADDREVAEHAEIQRIAATIEKRRVELGKTSGFERLYPRVTQLYFGGMARHFASLRPVLRPGAKLAYVVGDQASYLRVMIRTGQLLADIAQSLGYKVTSIDLFRTRPSTVTGEQLREEVLVLEWPGT